MRHNQDVWDIIRTYETYSQNLRKYLCHHKSCDIWEKLSTKKNLKSQTFQEFVAQYWQSHTWNRQKHAENTRIGSWLLTIVDTKQWKGWSFSDFLSLHMQYVSCNTPYIHTYIQIYMHACIHTSCALNFWLVART
jgi:hypothetical protein